jgi:sec-independent protein translocase protein TatC
MFLTPPDIFSQTLLAIPMYLLYESGLFLARVLLPSKTAAVT